MINHLVYSNLRFGNLRVYDLEKTRVLSLKPEFERLTLDPYVPEGFRRKHIVRYSRLMEVDDDNLLYQSNRINPTHGDVARKYARFCPRDVAPLREALKYFISAINVPEDEEILIQAQRVTCTPTTEGLPSVENWHRDGVTRVGIICVSRDNISGGINEFKCPENDILKKHLEPGQMAIFDDPDILHRVTPIRSADGIRGGHRDVLLFGFPSRSEL